MRLGSLPLAVGLTVALEQTTSMYPTRPHHHSLNRATTPTVIDFFAQERAEQQEITATRPAQTPLEGLRARSLARNNPPYVAVALYPLAPPNATVTTLRSFLRSHGHSGGDFMRDITIQDRLDRGNLSAETLLAALRIVNTYNHPLLAMIGASVAERFRLVHKLSGIVNQAAGFRQDVQTAAQAANNNPEQLIVNVLHAIRARHSQR